MIRTLLVDDQAVVRAGYRVLLEDAGDIEVVGEASNGPAAIRESARLRPDVVCMDVRMPGGDGIAATRQILAAANTVEVDGTGPGGGGPGGGPAPAVPAVLVVTTFDLDDYVFGALEAGASGFLLKDCEPEELITAVRRLAAGDGMVDQAVTRRVITEFARRTRKAPAEPGPASALTERETEIVRLLANGMSNAEIARELFVETSTVKSHLGRAMTKIGTRDRVQTVVWAYRHGLAGERPAPMAVLGVRYRSSAPGVRYRERGTGSPVRAAQFSVTGTRPPSRGSCPCRRSALRSR
ncbi:response regulator transcription factor [Myceligenerans salitolerans]|uniref:Response regulator transcription factor n=1 Tax=Myceligenerans salitolerans TaxID=1230528 RepID=A0ABS3IE85_9MICO|nr:response regulator transcription factor [Myceligenerans salitolerans]MBO0611295.1 response regulator transcription factor [Myceligenerans salitolerans]